MNHVILTPAIVANLVSDCFGTVKVLGIVGRCRTGKTLSLKQWAEKTRAQHGVRVAYADNLTLLGYDKVKVEFGGQIKGAPIGHYPMFDLNGADIVVVDEPLLNRELVERVFAHVDPQGGAFMHRLLILPIQTEDAIKSFRIPRSAMRLYSVAGVPL